MSRALHLQYGNMWSKRAGSWQNRVEDAGRDQATAAGIPPPDWAGMCKP
jgi:hypothetical protein